MSDFNISAWHDMPLNSLSSPPDEIRHLDPLREPDLSEPEINEQVSEFGVFNFSGMQLLTNLPEEIRQLDSLTWLDLSSIDLTNLPEEIQRLEPLRTLTDFSPRGE